MARLILFAHLVWAGFIVFTLLLTILGQFLHWSWIHNYWIRGAHLVAIGYVVIQTLFGVSCPLTWLESHFREQSGQSGYQNGFVMDRFTEWTGVAPPAWAFDAFYLVWFGLTLLTLFWIPIKQDYLVTH